MNTSSTLYSFKHEIGLRFIKLINLMCMVTAFAVAWFMYYDKTTAVTYYWKGDVAIIAFFKLSGTFFNSTLS